MAYSVRLSSPDTHVLVLRARPGTVDQPEMLVYVGPEAWAHQVAQFIERAKQIHAQETSVQDPRSRPDRPG
jgi:hypothetical protein